MVVGEKELALVEELNKYKEHAITKINTIYTGFFIAKHIYSKTNEEYPHDLSVVEKTLEECSYMFVKFELASVEFEDQLHLELQWAEYSGEKCLKTHVYSDEKTIYPNLSEKKLVFNLISFLNEIKNRINVINEITGDSSVIDLVKLESIILRYVNS